MDTVVDIKKKRSFKEKIKAFFENAFSTNKKSLLFLGVLLSVIMTIYFLVILIFRKNFYNNFSDDALQYYPFMCDFINKIKSGDLSWYSFKNYLGASFFSDTYYIPLDGFTLIIFIFSFVMPTEIAMSIVEIIKLIGGAIALGAYLGIKGYRPKVTFLIALLYFSSSGITCFSCFPCFTSLAFYLPFSLIIGHYFLKGKWLYVPLFATLVVLYNYYLAYMVFAFMSFSMLFMVFIEKKKIYKSILELISYIALILFGLSMAMVIFLPSMDFVLQSTSRNVAGGGSIKSLLLMVATYLDVALTFITCSFKALINVVSSFKGFSNVFEMVDNSFIQLRYLINTISKSRTIDGTKLLASLFDIEEYYRVMSTTFTPVTPSSFYGYQSSYFIEHISLYITGIGLVLSTYIWSMKDRRSNIYKIITLLCVFMMLLPFFSYILSANLEVLYTRWFNVVTIPMLLIAGHVVNENGLYNLKEKPMIIGLVSLLYVGIFGAYHHLQKIRAIDIKNNIDENIISFENILFYLTILGLIIIFITCIVLNIKKHKNTEEHKKHKLKTILTFVVSSLLILSILTILLIKYLPVSDTIWKIERGSSADLFSIDVMMAYQYLSILIMAIMIINTFAVLNKKKVLFGIILGIEVIISGCLSFGSSVILSGKEDIFKKTRSLSSFLNSYIDEPSTYRIYVDSSVEGILRTNLSSLIQTGCNTDVFHSFIYAGTDDVADLIFNISDEGQAGKRALNTYSYYLNVFLGYKYVVASKDSSFINYDENQFELVNKNTEEDYILLRFKDYQEFLSYDEYIEYNDFKNNSRSLNEISKEKELIKRVVIDEETLELLKEYNLKEKENANIEEISSSETIRQQTSFTTGNRFIVDIDGKKFYRYAFSGADEITTRSYAINLFGLEERKETLIKDGNAYLEFECGEIKYITSENIGNKNGSTFHIPIYGGSDKNELKPKYLYLLAKDQNDDLIIAPSLNYTFEAIFPSYKYLDSYENGEDLESGVGVAAAIRFHIDKTYDNKLINVLLNNGSSKTISYDTMYFEYNDGSIVLMNNESIVNKALKNIYIIKPNDVYNLAYPPSIKITTYSINDKYEDIKENKKISTDGSKINLSYTNKETSDGYEILMIPTAYSSEWKVVNGNVSKVVPVNGGFIGLVVPKNIDSNNITLKFEPEGLKLVSIISLVSILFYMILAVLTIIIRKKRKEAKTCQL